MVLTFILDKFLLTDSMHFIKAMYNKKNITSTIQGHNNRRYEKAINNKYSKRQYMIDANLWRNTVLNRYRLKFKIQDIGTGRSSKYRQKEIENCARHTMLTTDRENGPWK